MVFTSTGVGKKEEGGRRFYATLAMTLESDDERYVWLNDALCVAHATVTGRHVTMHVHRLRAEGT